MIYDSGGSQVETAAAVESLLEAIGGTEVEGEANRGRGGEEEIGERERQGFKGEGRAGSSEEGNEESLGRRGEEGGEAWKELQDISIITGASGLQYDTGFVSSQSVQEEEAQLEEQGREEQGGNRRRDVRRESEGYIVGVGRDLRLVLLE